LRAFTAALPPFALRGDQEFSTSYWRTFRATVTNYPNTGLKRNTTYRYRVRALNDSGNSAYSNTVSAKTLR
jgi:hypothetical protein